jgi:hypothetical protein
VFVADARSCRWIPAASTNLPMLTLAEHLSETL